MCVCTHNFVMTSKSVAPALTNLIRVDLSRALSNSQLTMSSQRSVYRVSMEEQAVLPGRMALAARTDSWLGLTISCQATGSGGADSRCSLRGAPCCGNVAAAKPRINQRDNRSPESHEIPRFASMFASSLHALLKLSMCSPGLNLYVAFPSCSLHTLHAMIMHACAAFAV